jgi:hypothetical protein
VVEEGEEGRSGGEALDSPAAGMGKSRWQKFGGFAGFWEGAWGLEVVRRSGLELEHKELRPAKNHYRNKGSATLGAKAAADLAVRC